MLNKNEVTEIIKNFGLKPKEHSFNNIMDFTIIDDISSNIVFRFNFSTGVFYYPHKLIYKDNYIHTADNNNQFTDFFSEYNHISLEDLTQDMLKNIITEYMKQYKKCLIEYKLDKMKVDFEND